MQRVSEPKRLKNGALRRAFGPLALGSLSVSCSALEIPRGPDLRDIAAIYDAPDGKLQEDELAEVIEVFEEQLTQLEHLGDMKFIFSTLEEVGEEISDAAKRGDGSIAKITGVTEVKGMCPGLKLKPDPNAESGTLEFTVTYESSYLEEVIWGRFKECQIFQSNTGVTIDSSMDIYLGGPISLARLKFDSLLFRLDGESNYRGETHPLAFDFRHHEGSMELRIPAKEGDVIFVVGEELERVAVRTREESFCCEFDERTCYRLDGDDCDSKHSGEKMTWR